MYSYSLERRLKAAAEVEELKEKIASLEAALKALSPGPHPLLREDAADPSPPSTEISASSSDSPPQASGSSGSQSSPREEPQPAEGEEEVLDAFGEVAARLSTFPWLITAIR